MTGAGASFEAIILAAGAGSRFGGRKLLAPFGDGVVLDGAIAAAFAAPVQGVTLVTGADAQAVADAARAFADRAGQAQRLRIVHAADHAEGMGASLRCGAQALPPEAAGAFVFLGDMPRIPHAVLKALAEAIQGGAPAAATEFANKRGHPAVFSPALFDALRAAKGDEGARAALHGLGDRLAMIEAPDDGVLFDVDTPADLTTGTGLDS